MTVFSSVLVSKLVDLALEEDLCFGDVTSALFSSNAIKTANIVARQELVVCGLPLTEIIVKRAGYSIVVESLVKDSAVVKDGDILQVLRGTANQLTSIERTALNFLQRLSGVATYTRAIMQNAGAITVLDTRKTTPGFRLLEKYATATGGAKNHRMHLGEMIMIKNNHIDAASGSNLQEKVRFLMNRVKEKAGYYTPVQVEVRTEEELKLVLEFLPAAVLLDNMDNDLISRCLTVIKAKAPNTICEVSGGLEPARLKELAALGVNAASMGRLTTRAPNVDISMRISS